MWPAKSAAAMNPTGSASMADSTGPVRSADIGVTGIAAARQHRCRQNSETSGGGSRQKCRDFGLYGWDWTGLLRTEAAGTRDARPPRRQAPETPGPRDARPQAPLTDHAQCAQPISTPTDRLPSVCSDCSTMLRALASIDEAAAESLLTAPDSGSVSAAAQ